VQVVEADHRKYTATPRPSLTIGETVHAVELQFLRRVLVLLHEPERRVREVQRTARTEQEVRERVMGRNYISLYSTTG
jgi:hypothetical protein